MPFRLVLDTMTALGELVAGGGAAFGCSSLNPLASPCLGAAGWERGSWHPALGREVAAPLP